MNGVARFGIGAVQEHRTPSGASVDEALSFKDLDSSFQVSFIEGNVDVTGVSDYRLVHLSHLVLNRISANHRVGDFCGIQGTCDTS